MAARSWATSITAAIGVAALAGAAQLGLAYGLGIVSWQSPQTGTTVWVSSLAWVAWLSATATVLGALVADRFSGFSTPVARGTESAGARAVTGAWRTVVALAAAVGALITVPLVAVPTYGPRPDNVAPYFTTGGYAVAGVIIGLLVAIGALSARAIAANVVASTAWLWTLAAVAVTDTVLADGELNGTAQLATWQFTDAVWVRGMVNLPGALLMLAIALVIGVLAAWPAGRRGDNRVGVAVSGATGPLLVTAAYFLAAPGLSEQDQQLSAFVIAPYAVLAGLAGSVLVSAIGPKGARTEARARRRAASLSRDARSAADISEWTQALAAAEAADTGRSHAPTPVAGEDDENSNTDLPFGGYASSRVYGSDPASRAYAEDTVEPEPASTGGTATVTATGRASVEPLWPERAAGHSTDAEGKPGTTKPAPARPPTTKPKVRRGKSQPSP